MEYIITEKTDKYGWCLFRICGSNKEAAEKALARLQAENPDKELRLDTVDKEDCWWNNPTLCN